MEKITDLLEGLRKVDPRLSKADFSRTYLNRNRTYLNYLEATGVTAPSAVWLCAYKAVRKAKADTLMLSNIALNPVVQEYYANKISRLDELTRQISDKLQIT